MKKYLPIIILSSIILAMNHGIEYWKDNAQPTVESYELKQKIEIKTEDKPRKKRTKKDVNNETENFPENVISYFTDQYFSFFENPIQEIAPLSLEETIEANNKANRMALACPVLPVPLIAFTNANVSSTGSFCQISLTATDCGSNTVLWYQNGIYQTTGNTYTTYPSKTSNYYAECQDVNSSCTSTQSNMIQIPVWMVRINPNPLPATICANAITLSAEVYNASSTPFLLTPTYQWNSYGNSIPSATNQSYNVTSSGYYGVTVKLPEPFPAGCQVNGYTNSSVNLFPTPTIIASTSTTVCPGNSVSMYWNYDSQFYQGSGTLTFQWQKDGINIDGAGATNQSFTATQGPGAYTLVVSKNGCSVTSAAINVTNSGSAPSEIPIISGTAGSTTPLASPQYTCAGQVTLYSTGCGAGQTIYWNNSSGITGSPIPAYLSGNPAGTTYFARCGTSPTCMGPTSNNLLLKSPMVEIIKTVGLTACDPTILTASTTPSTNVNFQWAYGGNNITGANTNQYMAIDGGGYDVNVYWTGLLGGNCFGSAYISTTSSPAVTTPTIKACSGINPTVCTQITSPVNIFSGTSVTLQASNCNATVNWSTGATGTSLVVSTAGTYTATCSNVTCTSPNSNSIVLVVLPCISTINLQHPTNDISSNPTTNGTLQQASATNGIITASNWITGGGTKVDYQAKSVLLSPGFIADTGTIFTASTGGCN